MHRVVPPAAAIMLALAVGTSASMADPGKPVAVQWWGQAVVSIETYWNLQIVIDPDGEQVGYTDPQLSADLVLITHEHPDHNKAAAVGGEPVVVHGLDADGKVASLRRVLDRLPNQAEPTWLNAEAAAIHSTHEVTVTAIPAWHDDKHGNERGATAMFAIDVDGVRIVHCGGLGQTRLSTEQLHAMGRVDVLLVPVGGVDAIDGSQAAEIVRQVQPRITVPIHYKTPPLKFDLQPVGPFLNAIEPTCTIERPHGNTLAVSASKNNVPAKARVVVLECEPWQPTGELAELYAAMESACRESQEVFRPLSIDQMNFRPTNGTHTPRWNAEHMMGRELQFFTQIFAAREPAITPLDLNPAQMPDDYHAAHPEWEGAEEARQMERVSALARRFGYLLDGVDLDEPAPGSRWTLRGLLRQMERHYGEHTANVKQKFELAEWPQE